MESELYIAHREAATREAVNAYFEARPQLDELKNRLLFGAAFERGFDAGQRLCDMQIAAAMA